MGKFHGKVGYVDVSVELRPGVTQNKTVEREYDGDLVRNYAKIQSLNRVNEDVDISSDISIIADQFAYEHFYAIRYVEYLGVKWKVTNVNPQFPRLVLTTGGVYNGR